MRQRGNKNVARTPLRRLAFPLYLTATKGKVHLVQALPAYFFCNLSVRLYNHGTTNYDDYGEPMNRRQFLGLALCAVAAPAFAKKNNKSNQPRILTLRHLHTDERITVTYRVGDHYQRDALHKLNNFLRDFRTGEVTAMDPKLFDLLYDLQISTGHREAEFEVFSGYRSPITNAMLRKASRRVAKQSLHMSGKAMDIRMCDCTLRNVRDSALALGRGGVGYYPRSNFVHVDTGPVRSWRA